MPPEWELSESTESEWRTVPIRLFLMVGGVVGGFAAFLAYSLDCKPSPVVVSVEFA